VIARLRGLYERRSLGRVFACMDWPSEAVRAFGRRYRRGFCGYPDPEERVQFWDDYWREHAPICDDTIPSAYLSEMDQGLYGGLVGGRVAFSADPDTGWISSMVHPILEDWSGLERLRFYPACEWWQRYLRQLDVFVRAAQGRFGVSHFILINGLNFVFEMFGATRTYMELIENPEQVRRALDLAFDLNRTVQRTFFDRVPLVAGGTCSNMMQWTPGRVVSESVDPFHMTSVDYFERWGRGVLERIFAEFDGGATHIHGNGRHLLDAVSSVRGLKAIYLGDDRGFPPAFGVLPELRRRVGDTPLVVSVAFHDFVAGMDHGRLVGGVLYMVRGVPGADEANRTMDRVRAFVACE
jgi:hypothetical protein